VGRETRRCVENRAADSNGYCRLKVLEENGLLDIVEGKVAAPTDPTQLAAHS
jgi:hypothetical protein